MKGAVVTGAAGFIGGAMVRHLQAQGIPVLAVIRPGGNVSGKLPQNVELLQWDLGEDPQKAVLPHKGRYDVFYHFAWSGSSREQRRDRKLQMANVTNTLHAVELAKQLGCKRFVGAGSLTEWELDALRAVPGQKLDTTLFYACCKQAAGAMSRCAAGEKGMDHIWGVITNTYGPGERSQRLVCSVLRQIHNGEPLRFTQGTQNYDFIYIDDLTRAFFALGQKGQDGKTYLLGSGAPRPLRQFLREMVQEVDPGRELVFGDLSFPIARLPLERFSTKALREDTGFCCSVPFAKGIRLTWDWLCAQPQ